MLCKYTRKEWGRYHVVEKLPKENRMCQLKPVEVCDRMEGMRKTMEKNVAVLPEVSRRGEWEDSAEILITLYYI